MSSQPRRAAYDILWDIEQGAYANLRLKEGLRQVPPENRPFVSALVYTVLDHQIYLDHIIDRFARGKVKPRVRLVLRMGICQMLYMDVPDSAACDESVKLVKSVGKLALSGYVNGVLRAVAREKGTLHPPEGRDASSLSIRYSWPQWLVKRYLKRYGPEGTESLLSYVGEKSITVRNNPFKVGMDELKKALFEQGIPYRAGNLVEDALVLEGAGDVAKNPLFLQGAMTVQSQSSMLVCRVANPRRGMRVLDACAAPGGKSLYMAALMGEGEILSWDVHPHRVRLIDKNCERLGVDFVRTQVQDATQDRKPLWGGFDLVLVDAPCSGLGVAGGKPDVKYARSPEQLIELQQLQLSILRTCAQYVAVGGALVYSTCTTLREENEDVVDEFLSRNKEFLPDDITPYVPPCIDRARCARGRIQLLPYLDGVEGFFVARMVRR